MRHHSPRHASQSHRRSHPPPPALSEVCLCVHACAAFITFLKSGNHSEAVARSAAVAMRHDSKMQSSAAYDKGKHDRTVAAAQRAAEQYARRFMAA